MAHDRLGHASLARCSQNLRRHIPCRPGGGRSSTKAGPGAGCPIGHRPCGDRTCRPNTGCCRSHDRPRASRPDRREGICLYVETVVAAKPSPRIPRPATRCKLSIPWGAKRRIATARGGCGLLVLPFTLNNKGCSQPPAASGGSHPATEVRKHGTAGSRWRGPCWRIPKR